MSQKADSMTASKANVETITDNQIHAMTLDMNAGQKPALNKKSF